MKIVYTILILTLSVSLLSCGGTADEEGAAPPVEAVETEAPHTSRAEAGENPGEFTLDDSNITLLGRQPRDGSQVLTFVYYRPATSVIRTYDVVTDLGPKLGAAGDEPVTHTTWKDVDTYNSEERGGEIFEALYPEITGECVLTVSTAAGPVTIELGDAVKTYRYAEKVRPGKKTYISAWPGRFPIFEEKSGHRRYMMFSDELAEGGIVFPTGELQTPVLKDEDGNVVEESALFKEVDTFEEEKDWVIADDEVFEYAGYLEKPEVK